MIDAQELAHASQVAQRLIAGCDRVLLGQPALTRLCVTGLLAGGHVLLEGLPGLGKTELCEALAGSGIEAAGGAQALIEAASRPADLLVLLDSLQQREAALNTEVGDLRRTLEQLAASGSNDQAAIENAQARLAARARQAAEKLRADLLGQFAFARR